MPKETLLWYLQLAILHELPLIPDSTRHRRKA
jgi:hypothetical protein